MKEQTEFVINQFQLNVLLNTEQKETLNYMINNGVYCNSCDKICSKGIQVKMMQLTSLNDIKIQGTCKVCNGKVTRILEFGEDKAFFKKATDFRKSTGN